MKIIIVSKQQGKSRAFDLNAVKCVFLSAFLLGIPLAISAVWESLTSREDLFSQDFEDHDILLQILKDQKSKIEAIKSESQEYQRAMAMRLAELQARLIRIDALGERITNVANLDQGEFDFSAPPAMGGPDSDGLDSYSPDSNGVDSDLSESYHAPDFVDALDELSGQLENREQQLSIIEELLSSRQLEDDVYIEGRPVAKGWISSNFGFRTDPFHGRVAWHKGVDFAGKRGSEILAVASGIVTWSGVRKGYGKVVEINHSNGYSTKYAHNSQNKVSVGDLIKKGQVIALMGTTGRSTGPHVHFEVYKNGRAVDPASYIHRTNR